MTLAIFDLDNTLLNGDSDHAWGEFLVAQGHVDEADYRRQNDEFYRQYQAGTLKIQDYLSFALAPLTQFDAQQLAALHQQFMAEIITPMYLPKAAELLAKHREQGHFLLIITATNDFVTTPIANWLGVDDILATQAEIRNQRYTGQIVGTPCFQQGKVTRLKAWLELQQHSLDGSYFYSDSVNDLPLLELVESPVVVDGDDALQKIAQQRQWPCISLRG